MNSRLMREVLDMIEADVRSRPSPAEFEMAYQARVAIDRIRFAIKHTEQFAPHTDQTREAGLQLLDALERLELADRNFQNRFRVPHGIWNGLPDQSPSGKPVRSTPNNSI